ncbi:MAG: tetratricopeptide repeat protein [Gemmatimonadaceae bacterium]
MTVQLSDRDRAILRSFAHRIDATDAGALNNLGVLYFSKGMTEDAVAAFTRALELDARMTIAQRNLEIAYFTSGYYDRCVEEALARLASSPQDRHARWELGRTFLLLGDVPRALDEFGVLLREDPDDVHVIRQVASAEAKCGDLEAASRWLHHALDVEPDNPAVLFQMGEVAYHRGLNEEARIALSRAVELAPDDADVLYLLGFVLGDQGDHDGAKAATSRALRINSSLGRARANLSLERFDARSYHHAREMRVARGLNDTQAGAESTRLAHHNLGLAFRHKGYFDEALKEYRIALERGEDALLVQQAMAEVHLLRGDMQAALQLYDTLLAGQPHNPKLWNERGVALHHAGRYADALISYERALEAHPLYAVALNNLGVAAVHAGNPGRAVDAFTKALQLNAGFVKARLNLAFLLVRQSEVQHALEAYRQVLRLAPEHPMAWNGVGLVLAQLKRFEDARNAFARAIEARTNFAEAHYNLSFTLSNLGDYAGALRETKRALELDAFYTPQKFELAIDLEHEDPRLDIAPDVAGERRDQTVTAFVFEPGRLEALFDDLSPEARPADAAATDAPYHRAYALLDRGDHARGMTEVRRAMADGAPRVAGLVALGDIFLARGAAGEALERYRDAKQLDAAHGPAVQGELRALVALHRFAEAVAPAEWLASFASGNADALLLVGQVRMETERIDDARQALLAARRLAPMRADVLRALGRLARLEGDTAAAIAAFRDALDLDRHIDGVHVELADLLAASGDYVEAERELEAAVASDPRSDVATLALARLRRERGQPDQTVALLADFLSLDPYHLEALAALGESLFLVGRRQDAQFAFARLRRFDPEHVAALYFEGVMLAEDHQFEAAIERWRRVIELEPATEFARRARRDARTAEDLRRILIRPARSVEAA